ncbi:hypothetical protein [Phenylobacterium aquaticum]|uniref:hypothetical protein n=1 Tax=Phenylobacterium aquaticum TaxID=1763816 RepID=UPI001F5CBDBB|nr:hypothetical protein [Phenylobacterium aquaticum]MCI3135518.1 hypothetical protein [Phenylobacterium aquaticum]
MDWAEATFFDRVIYDLWLDPKDVRARFDLAAIASLHRPLNEALARDWRDIAPGADAAVVEFEFRATGNAKRKMLRRLDGHVLKHSGGLRLRSSMSLEWLDDYVLAYEIVARECGGKLVGWRYVKSPLPD